MSHPLSIPSFDSLSLPSGNNLWVPHRNWGDLQTIFFVRERLKVIGHHGFQPPKTSYHGRIKSSIQSRWVLVQNHQHQQPLSWAEVHEVTTSFSFGFLLFSIPTKEKDSFHLALCHLISALFTIAEFDAIKIIPKATEMITILQEWGEKGFQYYLPDMTKGSTSRLWEKAYYQISIGSWRETSAGSATMARFAYLKKRQHRQQKLREKLPRGSHHRHR